MAPRNSNTSNNSNESNNPVSISVPSHSHSSYSDSSHTHNAYADKYNPPSAYSRSGHNHDSSYSKSGHNHDSSYFPYSNVQTEITNQVNDKWGKTSIGQYESDAETSKNKILAYEETSKTKTNTIVTEHEPDAKEARDETLILRDDAQLASEESKTLLRRIHSDYRKIVDLGMKSQQLSQIIANLAMHSKVLNSAIRTSTHLSNSPFDLNAINKDNVSSVIADAIRNPLENIGEFSYKGYTSSDYQNDILNITSLSEYLYNDIDMTDNYIEYRDNLENSIHTYKHTDNYNDSALEGVVHLLPDKLSDALLKVKSEPFSNMRELCGNKHTYDGEDWVGTIPTNWKNSGLNAGNRIKMCNAYHDKSETNENILELEELLAQKKNLASDVMLNYIINEDNNNQSTIKQVYDKINDENNLKLRKIKDKEYDNKKNIDNLKILKFAILLFLISVPFLMLHKKEIISINLLFIIIFGLIIIFVIFSGTIIYKQMAADKFNYNKIDKTIDNINTVKKTTTNRNTERTLNNNSHKFSSIFGCFKSDCCDNGTTYDTIKGKCV
tara:strand:- start:7523 stop:9184 length:1662 start_codon:yes stop_codon:yes gene_type:complete